MNPVVDVIDAGAEAEADELPLLQEAAVRRRGRQVAEEAVLVLGARGRGQCVEQLVRGRVVIDADAGRQQFEEQVPLARGIQHEILLVRHRAGAAGHDAAIPATAAAGGDERAGTGRRRGEQRLAEGTRHRMSRSQRLLRPFRRAGRRAARAGGAACEAHRAVRAFPRGNWPFPSARRPWRASARTRRR